MQILQKDIDMACWSTYSLCEPSFLRSALPAMQINMLLNISARMIKHVGGQDTFDKDSFLKHAPSHFFRQTLTGRVIKNKLNISAVKLLMLTHLTFTSTSP